MNENLKKFKEEVSLGRPRVALEHAVKLFEELFEKEDNKVAPKKVAVKKTAANKKEDDVKEDGNAKA
jgi:hypothetical protein